MGDSLSISAARPMIPVQTFQNEKLSIQKSPVAQAFIGEDLAMKYAVPAGVAFIVWRWVLPEKLKAIIKWTIGLSAVGVAALYAFKREQAGWLMRQIPFLEKFAPAPDPMKEYIRTQECICELKTEINAAKEARENSLYKTNGDMGVFEAKDAKVESLRMEMRRNQESLQELETKIQEKYGNRPIPELPCD